MSKRKKHLTTKNTMPKPPATRIRVIGVECNGVFELYTDFHTQEEFDKIFKEWFDNPETFMWCESSLVEYIRRKQPNRLCLTKNEYDKVKNKIIPATQEEWESENN